MQTVKTTLQCLAAGALFALVIFGSLIQLVGSIMGDTFGTVTWEASGHPGPEIALGDAAGFSARTGDLRVEGLYLVNAIYWLARLVVLGLMLSVAGRVSPAAADQFGDPDVPIIHNPAAPAGGVEVVHLEEMWRAGGEDGNEIFLYYIRPGEACTMSFTCCMMKKRSEIRTVAEDDTLIIGIPIKFMDDWMSRYQSWKNFIMVSYDNRMMEMISQFTPMARVRSV